MAARDSFDDQSRISENSARLLGSRITLGVSFPLMAPSPDHRAVDIQPKDAKQAIAEDKYDDCTACRVTGLSPITMCLRVTID